MARPRRNTGISISTSNEIDRQPESLEEFLNRENTQDLLRFITCGSVDDGKSTLIGRLLWESQQLFEDQLAALQASSARFGAQAQDMDFALLVDGLAAEREQGITIDVAYRYFATKRRKFIVADTPGHEQYTRNMITGASTADVALLLVDARHGVQVQTRRHAYLASLMGIRKIVLAVNKLDLLEYDQGTFVKISDEFRKFSNELAFTSITAIPISGLRGDNIVTRSPSTPWYSGPTLMGYLETVECEADTLSDRFVFPVQWVNRPDSNFRGFSGTVAEGAISVGDEIRLPRNGQMARVKDIVTFDGSLARARSGEAITLVLDKEIDISRGDVLSESRHPIESTDQFEATLVWLAEEPGLIGRNYEIKLATQTASASITAIKHKINVNTLAHEACTQLSLNDICSCNLSLGKHLAYDAYLASKTLGGFILIDRFSQATVAAGMIRHSLRRSQNVHRQDMAITIAERERLNGHKARVVWFTGLSGSGKSTLANALEVALHAQGLRTYILDGDNVRHGLNKDLGFTDADRVENIRRVAEVAKLMADAGLIVMTAFISPFRQEREMARELIGDERFIEVFVDTPLEICEQRDPKGLYKKARLGQIPNMTGVNSVYEAPVAPDVVIDHDDKRPLTETVADLARALQG